MGRPGAASPSAVHTQAGSLLTSISLLVILWLFLMFHSERSPGQISTGITLCNIRARGAQRPIWELHVTQQPPTSPAVPISSLQLFLCRETHWTPQPYLQTAKAPADRIGEGCSRPGELHQRRKETTPPKLPQPEEFFSPSHGHWAKFCLCLRSLDHSRKVVNSCSLLNVLTPQKGFFAQSYFCSQCQE